MADDDSWLYGEDGGEEAEEEKTNGNVDQTEVVEGQSLEQIEPTEDKTDEVPEDANASGSEDSDDDGIRVTIDKDKIEAAKTTYQSMQLKKNSVIDLGFTPSHGKEKKGKFAVEDFDNIGTVNGQTAVEVDLENLEEKPWRKPGADITDYFNYGFTEDTWAAYCNRQRRMRINESGAGLTGQSAILSQNRLTGSVSGTIPTLGGGHNSMMDKILGGPPPAKRDEPSGITVMTHEKRVYSNKVMTNMDFSVPPPGFSLPPPGMPPPGVEGEGGAPGGEFPPSDPFGEFGEGDIYSGGYEPTASAQWTVPPPGNWEGGGETDNYGGERGSYRDRDRRDRDRGRDYDRDRRRSRSRDRRRSRDRDRDRDRRDRDRDRDRDRERESDRDKKIKKEKRSRSRSRDRSRSPKHKKSKKDRKERDKEDRDRDKDKDKERDKDRENRETPTKVKEEPKD